MNRLLSAQFLLVILALTTLPAKAVETIKKFTEDMLAVQGYYNFYYDKSNDKLFLEVDKLKTPFLFQSSLPQGLGSNDIGLDRGQLGETRIVQFEQYGNKILLNQINTYYQANSDNREEKKSVEQAFAKSVIYGFEIKAKTRGVMLIDYTPFLLSDIHGISRTLSQKNKATIHQMRPAVQCILFAAKAFLKTQNLSLS